MEAAMSAMEKYISHFPNNMLEALEIGSQAIENFRIKPVEKILICGLGGSGIGGKIVSQLVWDKCKIPVEIVNDYRVPSYTDASTLVLVCSYSGNTEETLSALNEAAQMRAEIACITSGGKLREIAIDMGYNCIVIPDGQPPRTSFGYNATQVFFILYAYDLIDSSFKADLETAARLLKEEVGLMKAEAAAVANKIAHTIPVIYSSTHNEGVAMRLRQQINENAKMLCWHHVLPEMNHNELVGWAGGDDRFSAIFMHTDEDHTGVQNRMNLSKQIIGKRTEKIIDLNPKGSNRIEQAYYLIHLGDWISYFLAKESGVDPIEIAVIDYLKTELAKA